MNAAIGELALHEAMTQIAASLAKSMDRPLRLSSGHPAGCGIRDFSLVPVFSAPTHVVDGSKNHYRCEHDQTQTDELNNAAEPTGAITRDRKNATV